MASNALSQTETLTKHYREAIDKQSLPGTQNAWLQERRQQAWQHFESIGFPGSPAVRLEEWKYTRVKSAESTLFALDSVPDINAEDVAAFRIENLNAFEMVFVNGRYQSELSSDLPSDVILTNLAEALSCALSESCEVLKNHLAKVVDSSVNGFVALNSATMGDGVYLNLKNNQVLDKPLHIINIAVSGGGSGEGGDDGPILAQPRNLLVLGENAEATVVESMVSVGDGETLTNTVTECVLNANAGLHYYQIQDSNAKALHVNWLEATQARDSRFASHAVAFGGLLQRSDIHTHLQGEGAHVDMNGLYRLDGRQHVDFHTRIDHHAPHCTSDEFYKGVLDGRSRGVFNGKVYVHPHAQKTDSSQKNDNLLLSPHAEIDTKPELEIYADDVKCGHGATVGQLQDQSIFYLRSRGIGEQEARTLLVFAFANEILHRLPSEPVRLALEKRLVTLLPQDAVSAVHLEELVD